MFTFYFPEPQKRKRDLPWYLGNVLNCAMRYGEVYTVPGITGVIFVLPPGHTQISLWENINNGFLFTPIVMGFQNYQRSMACEKFVGKTHETNMNARPHYYLWGLAVDPAHQQSGVGSALMQTILSKADAEQMPIYLETHAEKNVAYYERKGFHLASTAMIPKYDLPFWCMVREPN
jgi:ribosomal protein S18 acetylase RimI-like enzyme